ncbi:MAG: porin [Arsenophonus endosymbiont of Dermacentor nuttalli]
MMINIHVLIFGQIRLKNSWDTNKNRSIIDDDASRIGLFVEHKLPHDVKVFGNIELGLDTQKSNSKNLNSRFELYNRTGYVSISHAKYGKAQFGRTYVPIDSVAKSNLGYNHTGVLYFADVLNRNTGISSGSMQYKERQYYLSWYWTR